VVDESLIAEVLNTTQWRRILAISRDWEAHGEEAFSTTPARQRRIGFDTDDVLKQLLPVPSAREAAAWNSARKQGSSQALTHSSSCGRHVGRCAGTASDVVVGFGWDVYVETMDWVDRNQREEALEERRRFNGALGAPVDTRRECDG
jgi:hypothetical protein